MKKYLIKYKWQNFLLFLLLVLTSGVSTGYAFLQMYIGKQVMEGIFRMVLITVVCNTVLIFSNSILYYIQNKYQTYLIAKMNQDFRNDISKRIMSASFKKLSSTDTGEYLSWYTNDVREAENQGFQVFYSCMEEALQLILGAVSLLFIRWEILLLTIVVSVISLYTSRKFGDKVEEYSKKVSAATEKYTDRI